MKVSKREDNYSKRREHLKDLSDKELKAKFWELTETIVKPLIKLSKENTSVAIERSVLLRMGFSSLEAKEIVTVVENNELLQFGAGHVVYLASKQNGISIKDAGIGISSGEYIQGVSDELRKVKN